MRIEQMKQFIDVAKSGSINATAQQRYISQQGLSDSLKRMEQHLGVALLSRDKTGVHLTQAGSDLLAHFQEVVDSYKKIEDYIIALRINQLEKKEQVMRVLTNPMAMSALIPDLLETIEAHYDYLTIHCTDVAPLDEMAQAIQDNSADYGIFMLMQFDADSTLRTLPKDVRIYPLFEDELVACVASDSELAHYSTLPAQTFNAAEKVLSKGAYNSSQTQGPEYISNNIDFQLKMILRKKTIGVSTRSLVNKTFPKELVTALPIHPAQKTRYYLMLANNRPLSDADFIFLKVLADLIQSSIGQKVSYNLQKLFPPKNIN